MGPKFTEGSIIQHLAKLRTNMVRADLGSDVPIPPALTKGMATKEPSKVYAKSAPKRKASDITRAIRGSVKTARTTGEVNPKSTAARRTTRRRGRGVKDEDSDSDDQQLQENNDDSDGEYGTAKKAKTIKKSMKKEEEEECNHDVKEEADDQIHTVSPKIRGRLSRPNYAEMEGARDDYEDHETDHSDGENDADDDASASHSPRSFVVGSPEANVAVDKAKEIVPRSTTASAPHNWANNLPNNMHGFPNGGQIEINPFTGSPYLHPIRTNIQMPPVSFFNCNNVFLTNNIIELQLLRHGNSCAKSFP
jgi:hypothetical protein